MPIAVLGFAGVELVNPDLPGQHHISPGLAQTLLGAALGALSEVVPIGWTGIGVC
jgi:hypothetical protein